LAKKTTKKGSNFCHFLPKLAVISLKIGSKTGRKLDLEMKINP
jgi:hypothetical protein